MSTRNSVPSTPSENVYGWPNGLNTNDGQTVTGCTPKDEMENTACTMMSVFGWSHPDLIGDMEEDIKSKILELNAIYWSKVNQIKAEEEERKRELKKREITSMLYWGDLKTATYTDGEHPDGPNDCFTSDGTPVSIISVTVLCGDETFEFNNVENPHGGINHSTIWQPAQEGNDGWRIEAKRRRYKVEGAAAEQGDEPAYCASWAALTALEQSQPPKDSLKKSTAEEKARRQKEYNEFMHPEDPSRGTPLSVYEHIDSDSD